ncbi:MAG TPA: ATP-dependent 6-phosphofructokinase [Conexivisphaerales archaeon]|nr:ATP-dependent 6-phosphofructokinase [Conexivisphaerales archaeon]
MKLGVLTGGGDCAGLNAVIRAVVRRSEDYGYEVVGIRRGWAGLMSPDTVRLSYEDVEASLPLGGTLLLTSRTNPYAKEGGPETVMANFAGLGLDCLIAVGGEDTLGVAQKLSEKGLKVVGVPKTIDNDLSATDVTFGFNTAVDVAMEAIDRIKTTGESHERTMVVEVMGRGAGWIATYAGIASGAHAILVPEQPFDLQVICDRLQARAKRGKKSSLIVVAEGARAKEWKEASDSGRPLDQFGHPILGGVGHFVAQEVERRTGFETREVVLGHLIRGGSPNAFDRVLATRFGVAAVDLVEAKGFGRMVALHGNHIISVDIKEALKPKQLDMDLLAMGQEFR